MCPYSCSDYFSISSSTISTGAIHLQHIAYLLPCAAWVAQSNMLPTKVDTLQYLALQLGS